jgi:hypothetical protein
VSNLAASRRFEALVWATELTVTAWGVSAATRTGTGYLDLEVRGLSGVVLCGRVPAVAGPRPVSEDKASLLR